MGKIKVRTVGKGKRWIKGHSCVSNPQSKKHRELAKSRFFQANLGQVSTSSSLTYDAVRRHDMFTTKLKPAEEPERKEEAMQEEEEEESDDAGTVKTFASEWTGCSNVSFNRLLNGFQAKSALHKEMLAALKAVTESLKSEGFDETPNDYFVALLSVLEKSETSSSMSAVATLLSMVIKNVTANLLQANFSRVATILRTKLKLSIDLDNPTLTRGLLGCLLVVVRAQLISKWSSEPSILETFSEIIAFIIHDKAKVRKIGQHAVESILKSKPDTMTTHPGASLVAEYCTQLLDMKTTAPKCILYVVGFLKNNLVHFPLKQLKSCLEMMLSTMPCGDRKNLLCGLQSIHGLMVARPPITRVPAELNARLLNSLFDFKPDLSDTDTALSWLSAMQESYSNLAQNDSALCLSNVPQFSKCVCEMLETDKVDIKAGAALALKVVVLDCLGEDHDLLKSVVEKVLGHLMTSLKYHNQDAWKYVINIIGAVYQVAGAKFPKLMQPSLRMMAERRDSLLAPEVDKAVGWAVGSMGPKVLLDLLPLQLKEEVAAVENGKSTFDFHRSWLLPVLHESIESAELKFFEEAFLKLSFSCKALSSSAETEGKLAMSRSMDMAYTQMWALFPVICTNPTDITTGFKPIARYLGTALETDKELHLPVMAGLRKLVTFSIGKEKESATMKLYAKNYLPILLNLYTSVSEDTGKLKEESGHRLAALETIKTYLQVTSSEMCRDLFDRANNKLKDIVKSKPNSECRDALLQLLAVLLPYQDEHRVTTIFKMCPGLINSKDQKRGYRLLEELCRADSEVCRNVVSHNINGILSLLTESLSTTQPPSRAARLRCLFLLLERMDTENMQIIHVMLPEAILCCRDVNTKCRNNAFSLLLHIGKTMQRWSGKEASEVIKDYLVLLLPGLEGTMSLVTATVLALASLINEYGDLMPDYLRDLLIERICNLALSSSREIAGACLSFFKAFLSIFDATTCEQYLALLVQSLVEMSEDCKTHFRVKCRDLLARLVRRHGMKAVASLVPGDDVIMHKRLKNIRKELDRKARNKAGKKQDSDDDDDMDQDFETKPRARTIEEILADSDDDLEFESEDEQEVKPKNSRKQSKSWIREDSEKMLDFTDPTATSRITATDPSKQKKLADDAISDKNRGFKTSADGRLIIKDDSDSDGEENKGRSNKRKMLTDSDEEMDVDDEEDKNAGSSGGYFVLAAGSKRRRELGLGLTDPAMKYRAGGSGIHRSVNDSRSQQHSGEEYSSKKAKGDVKKKGKMEPYAYVPLSGKLLNRRKRAKQAGEMKKLEVSAKKGAIRGIKTRAKMIGKRRT